jgi:3-hydroxyacyl-[acyl-carrier-protein] dehydratase
MASAGQFSVPADHACLPGHFPGRPVVPGVVLLDEAFALILAGRPGERLAAVDSVKFLVPVLPEQRVAVTWTETPPDRIAFSCVVMERTVLRGRARLCTA